uniref:4-hydroxy-3-methylbut-2-enyl diphosphate reductase n=1 Tax=Alexandrium monilatum TaxID=311494 RepID=A0A7S4W2Q1_9DINO
MPASAHLRWHQCNPAPAPAPTSAPASAPAPAPALAPLPLWSMMPPPTVSNCFRPASEMFPCKCHFGSSIDASMCAGICPGIGSCMATRTMAEAEYVAKYILGDGNREEFLAKFAKAIPEGFDPDVDLERVGVANQTTMLKGETELIGKLFERTMIKKYGPHSANQHFISFNTICDATQERQDAMYEMLGTAYEAPTSKLYAELEGEQVGVDLQSTKAQERLSSKAMEDETRGAGTAAADAPKRIDLCIVVGGFNSSNTTHLVEIVDEEGIPGYHIDAAERIGAPDGELVNRIQYKPVATPPGQAMLEEGLEVKEGFLPDGPVVIGLTSGASTPDNVLGDICQRILKLRNVE